MRIEEVRSAIGSLARSPTRSSTSTRAPATRTTPGYIARLLRRVGVFRIQGFFTNSTHQNWTRREIRYGRALVRRLGGRPHYVVNTAANGRGPLIPKSRVRFGNSFRCNAPGRGLGPKPTSVVPAALPQPRRLLLDRQPGPLRRRVLEDAEPAAGRDFWVDYAVALVRNADYRIR